MKEVLITTHKVNHLIDPHLHIWGWEVALYLFLGGVTAGILILSALLLRNRKGEELPVGAYKLPLWAPILLSLGMFCLFLDLEYKLHVWRFYTTFQITSPMSWGAWILLLVYPASLFLILLTLPKGYPRLWEMVQKVMGEKNAQSLFRWAEERSQGVLTFTALIGAALGIYTGILLSSYVARPFWNSALLGPIFLTSGVSTALALAALLAKNHREQHTYGQWDAYAIGAELVMIVLLLLTMLSSSAKAQESVELVLGGHLTLLFWVFVLFLGLTLPLILEILEGRGYTVPAGVAPLLVLVGGLLFRYVMVQAGQWSHWIPY